MCFQDSLISRRAAALRRPLAAVLIALGSGAWAAAADPTPDPAPNPVANGASAVAPGAGSAPPTRDLGCAQDAAPRELLAEIVAAHERADLPGLAQRLDPGMPGYGVFLDGAALDAQRAKLVRIHLFDLQWQCGPDLVALQTQWEKRYLDAVSHQPAFDSGRMSLLLVRGAQRWRLAAVAGAHPFGAAFGARAVLEFGPVVHVSATATGPTPTPLRLSVSDADLVRRGSVAVLVRSSSGDREVFTLPAVAPGRFQLNTLPMRLAPAQAGNGTLEVAAPGNLSLEYADEQPGHGQPALVLRRTASVVATTAGGGGGGGGTPGAFTITPLGAVGSPEGNVDSNPVVVTGLTAPAAVSVAGGLYAINGGPFGGAPGVVSNGDRIVVRVDNMGSIARTVTLTVGGRSASWTVLPFDDEPAPLPFTAPAAAPGVVVTSNTLVVSDVTVDLPITISGGSYSVNGGPFITTPGVVRNGQTLTLRATSSALPGGVSTVFAFVGGTTVTWQVRTASTGTDTVPDAFTIPLAVATPIAGSNPARCGAVDTPPVTPTGYNATSTLAVLSGAPFISVLVSVAGGPFVNAPVAIGPGQSFVVRIEGFGNNEIRAGATARPLVTVAVGGVSASASVLCN